MDRPVLPPLDGVYRARCSELGCRPNRALLSKLATTHRAAGGPHPALTTIDLSRNVVGPKGARAVATVARKARRLESLSLRGNNLDNASVADLTAALDGHPSLTALDLGDNDISHDAGKQLASFARRNPRLRRLRTDDTVISHALRAVIDAHCTHNTAAPPPMASDVDSPTVSDAEPDERTPGSWLELLAMAAPLPPGGRRAPPLSPVTRLVAATAVAAQAHPHLADLTDVPAAPYVALLRGAAAVGAGPAADLPFLAAACDAMGGHCPPLLRGAAMGAGLRVPDPAPGSGVAGPGEAREPSELAYHELVGLIDPAPLPTASPGPPPAAEAMPATTPASRAPMWAVLRAVDAAAAEAAPPGVGVGPVALLLDVARGQPLRHLAVLRGLATPRSALGALLDATPLGGPVAPREEVCAPSREDTSDCCSGNGPGADTATETETKPGPGVGGPSGLEGLGPEDFIGLSLVFSIAGAFPHLKLLEQSALGDF